MEDLWDQRYSEPGFAYGKKPNDFFREQLELLEPGTVLLPGEGEGRNAVFAALKGWDVTAFDQSGVARSKALKYAESEGVNITYIQFNMLEVECTIPGYDLMALIYIHLPSSIRQQVHRQLTTCLKPGARMVLEAFHKTQLNYNTGGPPSEDLLYSEGELRDDFSSLDIIRCENVIETINEGKYHTGESSIIRLIAQKP